MREISNYKLAITNWQEGFSVIEVILAAALFVIFSTGIVSVVLQGFDANRLGSEETIANQYASEGIEAVRSIKNQSFTYLVNSAGTGVVRNGSNVWAFSGANNTFGKYTRVITVTDVLRDSSGNIVASGGTLDANTKKITSTVSWSVTPTRNDSVVLNAYLTGWDLPYRGGMLVYGDGGTTADTIKYRTLDPNTGTWSSVGGGAVSFDAFSKATAVTSTSITWSHVTGAASNRILVVSVGLNSTTQSVSSISYNGVTTGWTKIGAQTCSGSGTCRTELWYLLNPASGSNSIVVTLTGSAKVEAGAVSYSNVDQTTPTGTAAINFNTTNTISPSLTVTSNSTNQKVVEAISTGGTATLTAATGQTVRWSDTNFADVYQADITAGASNTSLSWTKSTNDFWADIGVALNPTAATGLAADVDGSTTNKAVRGIRVYSSSTRNEKVIVSRHYNGSGSRFLYAQVYNGSSWGNVNLLAPAIASNSALDIQDFDGTYLSNGDFMVVYSDNTTTPKFKTWNGTAWSVASGTTGTSMQALTGVPVSVVASARAGTNEVMTAFFNNARAVQTEYYNGSGYITGNWALTTHTAIGNAPLTTKKFADFAWSPNTTTTGALIYADAAADTTLAVKVFVANGSGGGTWSASVVQGGAQTNTLGALGVRARPGANEFQGCDKDAAATPTIVCRKIIFSGATPTVTTPTNPILISGSDTGIQRSFDFDFEGLSGDPALNIYSDNTSTPKYKKYTASTAIWDSAATSLTALTSTLKSVRVISSPLTNDIMILLADGTAPPKLYSQVWDGTNNLMYTTPSGFTFTAQGTNGSATTELWYDFAWDRF